MNHFIHLIFAILKNNCIYYLGQKESAHTALIFNVMYIFSDINFIGKNNHEFDLLIFTQRWPVTTCLTWMEESHKHTCSLPSPKEIWTIHGIWPTKFGTIGPAFCNSSATFNPDELKPFQSQLEQFWLNIEAGTFCYNLFVFIID